MFFVIKRAAKKKFISFQRWLLINNLCRCYSSNLLLDSNEYYKSDSHKMLDSIKRRNITLDLSDLKNLTKRYEELKKKKNKIEISRVKISEEINRLNSVVNCDERKCCLNITAKILREDLKFLKTVINNVEKQLSPFTLKLPNLIDNRTLDHEVELFHSPFKEKQSDSHVNIGHSLNVLEFFTPTNYFLKNSGASLEISILYYVTEKLIKNEFKLFLNPDFCRTVIKNISGEHIISLGKCTDNDFLYLHGGASHIPFLSFFYNSIINGNDLPIRLVAQGRKYNHSSLNLEGLYTVQQKSAVQIFIVACNETVSLEFENVINYITNIYQSIEVPFKISYCSTSNLLPSESLRANVEVYSAHYRGFKHAGNISLYNDYFSKRSNMYYYKNGINSYTHLISGTVVTIPSLIASIIEYKQHCELPKCIQKNQI